MDNKVVAFLLVGALASASTRLWRIFLDGIIRIGDECFFVVDDTWFQTPCPREVDGGN